MVDPISPALVSARSDFHRDIVCALDWLDSIEHLALYLIYWRGLTQAQVAAELGLPTRTIGTAVARGMHQLGEQLIRS